jgi:hypothetical protein
LTEHSRGRTLVVETLRGNPDACAQLLSYDSQRFETMRRSTLARVRLRSRHVDLPDFKSLSFSVITVVEVPSSTLAIPGGKSRRTSPLLEEDHHSLNRYAEGSHNSDEIEAIFLRVCMAVLDRQSRSLLPVYLSKGASESL